MDEASAMHYPEGAYGGAVVNRFVIAVALCFALGCPSFAQTSADAPASKEDVEKYLEAIHSHEMMKQMVQAMSKPMHDMVHEQYLKSKDQLPQDFEERTNKSMDEMMRELPFDEMLDAMVPAYQKHFTKGDIEALTAFYSTPTGQKILREMPAIMSEAMETMMPLMRKSIDHMTQRLQDQMAEMMKQPAKDAGKTAPAAKN